MLAANQVAETEAVVVVHRHAAVPAAALGGDENHAERCARTVDARGCSVFQHGDALDVLRVHGVNVTLHAVDEDQRLTFGTLTDGGRSAHVDAGIGVQRAARRAGNLQSRNHALQGLGCALHRPLGQFVAFDHSHGPSEVHLFLCAEAHNNHFVQVLGVLDERNPGGAAAGFHGLRFVAHVGNLEQIAGFGLDSVVSVKVGHGAFLGAHHLDGGTDDGFAVGVHHPPVHHSGLLDGLSGVDAGTQRLRKPYEQGGGQYRRQENALCR